MNWTYSESFAGIGAWGKAIQRVTKRHNDTCELKWYAEIDKYASNAFSAIHKESEEKNIWDITQDIKVDPMDIFFYSPPCQTFSIAGKREGVTVAKGNLFYEATKFIKQTKPKYTIMENVKGLPSGDTKKDFVAMLKHLENMGYFNYWKVLNTKDYGIPQNRERVFVVSIRKDLYNQGKRFEFPKPFKLNTCMHDYLQVWWDKKYLLSQKMIDAMQYTESEFEGRFKPKEIGEHANCIDTKEGGRRTNNFIKVKSGHKKGYDIAKPGDIINLDQPNSTSNRNRVPGDVCSTLTTSCNVGYYNGDMIRKLTPLECFRLQGFVYEDYYKAVKSYDKTFGTNKDGTTKSDAQMYMRAGNSITVNVIEEILENLLYDRKQDFQQLSLF